MTGPAEVAAPIASGAEVARLRRLPRWATSLTAKYALVFALLAAVPMLAVSAYLLDSSYNRSRQHLIQLQQEKAKSLAVTVEQTLRDQVSRLTALNVYDKTPAERELLLRSVLLDTSVLATGYVDARGREVARLRRSGGVQLSPENLSHQPFFEQARDHGAYFGPVVFASQLAGPQRGDLELSFEIDVGDNAGGVVREALRPRPQLSEVIVATHPGRQATRTSSIREVAPSLIPISLSGKITLEGGSRVSRSCLRSRKRSSRPFRQARPRAGTFTTSGC